MLIIEDGTIVTGANSFTTDVELAAYALARGMDLPATEAERDILQVLAIDYIFSIENELEGCRVSIDQELPYPRKNVCAYGFIVPSDSIPQALKNAQMELAILAVSSGLLINGVNQNIQREKLGDLEVEYFSGGSWSTVRTDSADTYLKPLLKNSGHNNTMERV